MSSTPTSVPLPPYTLLGTLGDGDSKYGWGPAALGSYPESTYVEIRIEGIIQQWTSGPPYYNYEPTYMKDVDPAGVGGPDCFARVRVVFERGSYQPCDSQNNIPLREAWTHKTVVFGAGAYSRAAGPNQTLGQCNKGDVQACYLMLGEQQVTVTPTAATLVVSAERTSIVDADTVMFTASVSGTTPWQIREWIWQADEPTLQLGSPVSTSPDGRTHRYFVAETGTMYVRAKVGARIEQASVRIIVAPDTIILEASSDRAVVGEEVTFTARAALGTPFEVLQWSWVPLVQPDSTVTCSTTAPVCSAEVFTSGSMSVRVRFPSGREDEAAALVDVKDVRLNCPSSTERGTEIQCTITVEPAGVSFQVDQWLFVGSGYTIPGPTSGPSWGGRMAVSGTVTVRVTIDNGQYTGTAEIIVTPRNWSWGGMVGGQQGSLGELDHCIAVLDNTAGLTAGVSCSQQEPGALTTPTPATIASGVGYSILDATGPNAGLWYVSSATAGMQLRTQLNILFRSDGPAFPMVGAQQVVIGCTSVFGNTNSRNTDTVNTQCVDEPGFASFVNHVWNHEAAHMNAGLTAGWSAQNDVHGLWEPVVSEDATELDRRVRDVFDDAYARIFDAAHSVHATHTPHSFGFFRFIDSQWQQATTITPY